MKQKRVRDSQKSREDILKAAEEEFAGKGIYGARIDTIAAKAGINKRMIYEYYGSKEELYKAVLAAVYRRLSQQEIGLLSEEIPCVEAFKRMIRLYFEFLRDNPTYVNLILWENLNQGQYIREMSFTDSKDPAFDLMRKVIVRGKADGSFRQEIDADQVILSLLTYTFSYFSNRYTLSKLLGMKLDSAANMNKRVDSVTEMFVRYLCR